MLFHNLSTQTYLEIDQDYDLDGGTLDLSQNPHFVLRFTSGVLRNGTIKANKLIIEAPPRQCFSGITIVPYGCKDKDAIANDTIDVRWFGVVPNDNTFDCRDVVKRLKPFQKPMKFPSGRFYFSEYRISNKREDCFAIIGEQSSGLGFPTEFYPMDTKQRYIFKIGGGRNCFGLGDNEYFDYDEIADPPAPDNEKKDTTQRGYNIRIERVAFRWSVTKIEGEVDNGVGPFVRAIMSHTQQVGKLSNNYNTDVEIDYPRSALILDRVEKGRFDISGGMLVDIPLLTLCHAYECFFENIIMYHNEGRSDLPIIQVINATNASISTTIIKRMMFENVVGPLIKTYQKSSISELIINDFFFEQSASNTYSVGNTELRYTEHPANFDRYKRVPCFDFCGYGAIIVDNMMVSCANATWGNKYDNPPTAQEEAETGVNDNTLSTNVLGSASSEQVKTSNIDLQEDYTIDRVRSFVRYANEYSNYTSLYIKSLRNSMMTQYAYVEGGYERGSQKIKVTDLIGMELVPIVAVEAQSVDGELSTTKKLPLVDVSPIDDKFVFLQTGIKYDGASLLRVNKPYFKKDFGQVSIPTSNGSEILVYAHANQSMLAENGIKISDSADKIILSYYIPYDFGNSAIHSTTIRVEYYLLGSQSPVDQEELSHETITNDKDLRIATIKIKRETNFDYLVLKSHEYTAYLKSINVVGKSELLQAKWSESGVKVV